MPGRGPQHDNELSWNVDTEGPARGLSHIGRGSQKAVGNVRAGSTPAAPTMKGNTMEINECRPEIAASIASDIRAVAAWLDRHADDLTADMGRMLVVDG